MTIAKCDYNNSGLAHASLFVLCFCFVCLRLVYLFCQFFWIFHYWLPLLYSLTFICQIGFFRINNWNHIRFSPPHLRASQDMTHIPTPYLLSRDLFVLSDLRREVIVHFVDIGEIVDHYFFFIIIDFKRFWSWVQIIFTYFIPTS